MRLQEQKTAAAPSSGRGAGCGGGGKSERAGVLRLRLRLRHGPSTHLPRGRFWDLWDRADLFHVRMARGPVGVLVLAAPCRRPPQAWSRRLQYPQLADMRLCGASQFALI